MDKAYYIETLEQLKAVSDPIRWRMLSLLTNRSMTGAQLARELDIPRARAHYHLKILKNADLLVFEKEQLNRGMMEKYYRAIAERIYTSKMVEAEEKHSSDEVADSKLSLYRNIIHGMMQMIESDLNRLDPEMLTKDWYYSNQNRYNLTQEQKTEMIDDIKALLAKVQAMSDDNQKNVVDDLHKVRYTLIQTLDFSEE